MFNRFSPHDLTSAVSHPPFVVTSSSAFGGFPAWQAFGGDQDYWLGSNAGVDWLQLDIGSGNSEILTYYQIKMNEIPEPDRAPKDWTMKGSNDGVIWDVLDTVAGETAWANGETRTFQCDVATTAYRYFRLDITANNGHATLTQVDELFLYRGTGPTDLNRSAWTAYADSSEGTNTPDKAIDNLLSTRWRSNTPPPFGVETYPIAFWVDMGSAQQINYLRFRPPNIPNSFWPKDVEIYLSDDGVNWGSPVAWASLPADVTDKTIMFGTRTQRWLKIHMINRASSFEIAGFQDFNIGYDPEVIGILSVNPRQPPNGEVDRAYFHAVQITGGVAPYSAVISAGALPAGLAIDNDGLISGTPTEGGDFTFTIQVTDDQGTVATAASTMYVFRPGDPTLGAQISSIKFFAWSKGIQTGVYVAQFTVKFSFDGSEEGFLFPGGLVVTSRQGSYEKTFDELDIDLPPPDLSLCIVWVGIIGTLFGIGQLNEMNFYGCYLQADYDDGSRQYSYPTTAVIWEGDMLPTESGWENPANAVDFNLTSFAYTFRTRYSGLSFPDYLKISGFGNFQTTPAPPPAEFRNWAL